MSRHVWSPGPLALSGREPAGLAEREAEAIVAVLRREGPLDARTVREGRVRRVGRRTWAAVD